MKDDKIAPLLAEYRRDEQLAIKAARRVVDFETRGVSKVLRKLDSRIKERGLRVSDVFAEMDESGDGSISGSELAQMLTNLMLPPPEVRAAMKIRKEKMEAKDRAHEAALQEAQAIIGEGVVRAPPAQPLPPVHTAPLANNTILCILCCSSLCILLSLKLILA